MRGAVNPLSVLLIAAAIGGLYAVIMFLPPIIDNLSVREACDIGVHTAEKFGDEAVTNAVLNRINNGLDAIGSHIEEDPNGGPGVEKPGLGLTADNVTVTRDASVKIVHVSVDYTRSIRMKPTASVKVMTFHVEKEGSYTN